ncbi:hypothetical protein [Chamaesiphon sp.]|uniref:hypothetical protein n=1 Tax=Chamaesiphon sp. TaxID=2814140 RepID=UPI003593943F
MPQTTTFQHRHRQPLKLSAFQLPFSLTPQLSFMTTLNHEFEQLAKSVNQTLIVHQHQLEIEQTQIQCLTQLLNSCTNSGLDIHCVSAIDRLTDLLDRHQQSATQVYNVLNTLTQSKDAQYLTIDSQGEIATYLKLELGELATRLSIVSGNLLTAANNANVWAKLMNAYPDPDGYQWQFPTAKRGFFHKTHLHAIGTKTVKLVTSSPLN